MAMVPHMMDDYQRERVQFRKILLGILSERHRWSQCVEMTNKKLGMAVGVLFIRDNFNQESKVRLNDSKQLEPLNRALFFALPGNGSSDDPHDSRGIQRPASR